MTSRRCFKFVFSWESIYTWFLKGVALCFIQTPSYGALLRWQRVLAACLFLAWHKTSFCGRNGCKKLTWSELGGDLWIHSDDFSMPAHLWPEIFPDTSWKAHGMSSLQPYDLALSVICSHCLKSLYLLFEPAGQQYESDWMHQRYPPVPSLASNWASANSLKICLAFGTRVCSTTAAPCLSPSSLQPAYLRPPLQHLTAHLLQMLNKQFHMVFSIAFSSQISWEPLHKHC